jgi:hypothetical protein
MARRCWLPALVCTFLGLSWQLLTIHFNYGGNATALFCSGSNYPPPPGLAAEHIYVFPDTSGYDGQFYHYVAHDPFYRNGIGRAVDDPSLRYRRILIPALAWLLAFGHQQWIDVAFFSCNLAFLFLGAWWLAQLLGRLGWNIWYSVLYLAAPATVVSLDRMTVDLALVSLALGFAVYVNSESRRRLYLVLLLAALCRDTGFYLTLACVIPALFRRRFREAAWLASATVPAVFWNVFVSLHLPHSPVSGAQLIPFFGWIAPWLHPVAYPFSAAVNTSVRAFDYAQLLGLSLAFLLGVWRWREVCSNPIRGACLLWAATGLLLPPLFQQDCYSSARVFTPLLIFEFLESLRERTYLPRWPLAMVAPRIWLQLTPQVWGVVRGLF